MCVFGEHKFIAGVAFFVKTRKSPYHVTFEFDLDPQHSFGCVPTVVCKFVDVPTIFPSGVAFSRLSQTDGQTDAS